MVESNESESSPVEYIGDGIAYAFHPETGEYQGEVVAQESPREPGVLLLPMFATFNAPPPPIPGKRRVISGEDWVYEDMPVEAPPPEPAPLPASITPLQFIERFTEAEQIAIVTAAMSNPELRLWYDKLMAAQEVVFSDPRLSSGLDALVAAGLITAERKAELLTS